MTPDERIPVGRRVFLGLTGLGLLGIFTGGQIQRVLRSTFGSGFSGLLPGGDHVRIYSITGKYPVIKHDLYRLNVSGLVDHPATFTLADLQAMPSTTIVRNFMCVTGWSVPQVEWTGVRLSDLLSAAGVQSGAKAVSFDSYDHADSESLTIDQAHMDDVIVAYRMLGAPVTVEHGGPVRLYVAPMFGYKSLKWLSGIRVVNAVQPGFWELNGYPANGWLDGTTGPTNPDPQLT